MRWVLFSFFLVFLVLSASEERCFLYFDQDSVEQVGMIDKEIYREAVKQLPICCVDVFLFDPLSHSYLLLLRTTPPAQGSWWFPGGRLFKGESFFDCAIRKCKEETGLEVLPLAHLSSAATIFPDSAWDCQTHTVNMVVVAKVLSSPNAVLLDRQSEGWLWQSLDCPPQDPYLNTAYQEAIRNLQVHINLR